MYNIDNMNDVIGRNHKWARILDINDVENTATVEILDANLYPKGKIYYNVPIYYNCDPNKPELSNLSASAFEFGDFVVVRFDKNSPKIVSRLFGLRQFKEIGNDVYEVRPYATATKCSKPILCYCGPYLFAYDIHTDSFKSLQGFIPVGYSRSTMYKGIMYAVNGIYQGNEIRFFTTYNPQTKNWKYLGTSPFSREWHSMVSWRDGIYIYGGSTMQSGEHHCYSAGLYWRICRYLYHLKLNNQAEEQHLIQNFPTAFYLNHKPVVPKSLIVEVEVFGKSYKLYDTGETYQSDIWDEENQAIYCYPNAVLNFPYFYIYAWIIPFSGYFYIDSNIEVPLNIKVKYNYATWHNKGIGPMDLTTHAAAVLNDKMYIFGGDSTHNHTEYPCWSNKLFIYDFLSESWSEGPECPFYEFRYGIKQIGSTVCNNKLYFYGGSYYDKNLEKELYDNKLLMFDGSWHIISTGPKRLAGIDLLCYNNKLYLIGGFYKDSEGNNHWNYNLYIYDLNAGTWSSRYLSDKLHEAAVCIRNEF